MARPRRLGRPQPEARLDPIRWRRPGRGALLRLVAIAALLITGALFAWSGPATCGTSPTGAAASALPARAKSSAVSTPAADAGQDRTTGNTKAGGEMSGPDRAAVPAGTVGVPVRLAEPTALTLVRTGDHVDLFRVGDNSMATTAVAAAALVLGVTGADDPTAGGLLLALTPAEAAKAVAEQGGGFAVQIRP
jgi:hypothetical protein